MAETPERAAKKSEVMEARSAFIRTYYANLDLSSQGNSWLLT